MNDAGSKAPQTPPPIVVGIGASAGGIQALRELFSLLPRETGAAFVVILHLDPEVASDLARVLSTHTSMKVVQVNESEVLAPDVIYVIPPDRRLQITGNRISAVPFDEPRGHRAPIDLFFRSLAEHGDGFAMILTGAGSDGALGVRAVKEAGGIIMVQEPSEAEFPSMPRAALTTGLADFVLPIRHLAPQLAELIAKKRERGAELAVEFNDDQLRRILGHLRIRTGHDFTKYKQSTVVRRIGRRMQVTRTDDLDSYYAFLRDRPDETQALLGDLLISVTSFFRDREAFETLKQQAIRQLFNTEDPASTIRVWVPGCATGEEAYSICILLLEEASRHDIRPPIQLFASDIDSRALAAAREGMYPLTIEADVSEERLRRFFIREKDGYRIRQEVRDIVLFAVHDLLKDPPFSRVDLISCRNVMIYLDRELQEQACSMFHYALNANGFLLVGSSESADGPPGLFRVVDRNSRLYQSTATPGERPKALPRLIGTFGMREQVVPMVRSPSPSAMLSEAAAHRRAIDRLAPPSVLVDASHRAIHLSDSAGRYLQPSGGPLNSDLVDLVRPELRFELRSALHRSFEQRLQTLSLPIPVRFNGASRQVIIQVKPVIDETKEDTRQAIVMFIEGDEVGSGLATSEGRPTDEAVRRLTEELEVMQGRLRTVREESEASNEELRAANEELQSINEEYRSTSEELETSKEELQSINEELQTVNSELKLKLEAISRAHSDLQNLMAATDIGTLFLDTNLRVNRFTDRVTELFSLTPADEGRSITDFAHKLEYDALIRDARSVIADLAPIRREVRSRDGHWFDVRLRPYRTVENKIDGVVLTFLDISERLKAESALRESERDLSQQKRLVALSRDPIFVWDFDRGIVDWNRGSEELYGFSRAEAIDKDPHELLRTTVAGSTLAELRSELARTGSWAGELVHMTKRGAPVTVDARFEMAPIDGRRLVLETTRDITERKQSERRQGLLLGELTHRVKNTLAVVQSMAQQTLRSTASSEDFVQRFSGRLAALSSTHGLLVQSNWVGADFRELALSQLAAHASDPGQLRLEGPSVVLPADIAAPFGLVLHELVTNAVKYGALSVQGGRINLTWKLAETGNGTVFDVLWKEEGGPSVSDIGHTGFGSTLIERGIPDAKVSREWPTSGFVCRIEVRLQEAANHEGLEKA